jgi:hypothetical protein
LRPCFQLSLRCRTPSGDVDLSHASVDVLNDHPLAWPTDPGRIRITDFTFRQLRNDVQIAERLEILRVPPTGSPDSRTSAGEPTACPL